MQAERLLGSGGAPLAGPLLITPRLFADERGFFYESFNQAAFAQALAADGQAVPSAFVQDNHSRSSAGVLRGLHYQLPPSPQGKLVRCGRGEIFDVAVDLRRASPSFGQWVAAHLSEQNHQQLWVPEGFAHGFLALSASAEVLYKTTDFWDRACERSLRWDDPDLAIAWPLECCGPQCSEPQLAPKDAAAPCLAAVAPDHLFP
jgi:dTDP-4-dehydrorhamnose 3,5-epimerase